jgi:hypothetical protein
MLRVLRDRGLVSAASLALLNGMSAASTASDREGHPLGGGESIRVDEETLYTLYQAEILEPVLDIFKVFIDRDTSKGVFATVKTFDAQRETCVWHDELWNIIDDHDSRILFEACEESLATTLDEQLHQELPLASLKLAIEKSVPLITDDRCLQMLVINEGTTSKKKSVALDTSHLLMALRDQNVITLSELSDAYRRLIEWRYRFLVPPADVLKFWADAHRQALPGAELKSLSAYVHSCIRDPGLFRGWEKTDPPTSLATRLAQEWAHRVGTFLMSIWQDEQYPRHEAMKVTNWAVEELLPSMTKASGRVGILSSEFMVQTLMSSVLIAAIPCRKNEHANQALRALKEAFGLSDKEYFLQIEEIVKLV